MKTIKLNLRELFKEIIEEDLSETSLQNLEDLFVELMMKERRDAINGERMNSGIVSGIIK